MLPGIGLVPIEFEIRGKATSEGAKPAQPFSAVRILRDGQVELASDMDVDLIAFFELQLRDQSGWKANDKTVTPFGNLHGGLQSIH